MMIRPAPRALMVAAITTTLAACGGGGDSSTPAATASTPAPAPAPAPAPTPAPSPAPLACTALLSGAYRIIAPRPGPTPAQSAKATLDATSLRYQEEGDVAETLVPNGDCRLIGAAASAHPTDIVVSQASVLMARYRADDGKDRLVVGFPEQTHTLAELAGTWNLLGTDDGNAAAGALYHGYAATATLSPTGQMTNVVSCDGVLDCVSVASGPSLRVNSAGGFDLVSPEGHIDSRCFAYGFGADLMLSCVGENGSLLMGTPKRTEGLSAVDTVTSTWSLWSDTSGISPNAVGGNGFKTTANDAAAGTWTRRSTIDGHQETLYANLPRPGYTRRLAGTATADDGSVGDVLEFTSLRLKGMGLSVLWLPALSGSASPAPGALFFSVQKP